MKAISNSSPLILLNAVGYVDLLERFFSGVVVPDVVIGELERHGTFPLPPWIHVQAASHPSRRLVMPTLGPGEAAVLALWSEGHGDLVLLDDRAARSAARALGAPVIGTLGILLRAREVEAVDRIEPVLRKLVEECQYRIDLKLVRRKLAELGEWPGDKKWP